MSVPFPESTSNPLMTRDDEHAGRAVSVRKQIGIVDDHPAVVIGVTSVINTHPSLFVSGAGATLTELLRQSTQYDLVLLDLTLGDGSTPTTNVRSLVSRGIPVLVYTSGDQPQLIREAVRAGAMGMVRKSEFPQRIVAAIIEVLRGQVAATPDWAAAIDADDEFVSASLTDRETQVLALYASGKTTSGSPASCSSPARPCSTTFAGSAPSTPRSTVPRPANSTSTTAPSRTASCLASTSSRRRSPVELVEIPDAAR